MVSLYKKQKQYFNLFYHSSSQTKVIYIMNFSKSAHPRHKGSCVWKRNSNTSQTKRKDSLNLKKIRLTSQTTDYSNLAETQHSLNIKTNTSKSKNKDKEWVQIKSMAKYSTIASRMQLKKSFPISFLDLTDKKSPKRQKIKSSFEYNTFDRMIDSEGNITKSFKDSKQFKSLNPHISKDVQKMKKRVYSMYKQEKRKMSSFLGQNQSQTQNTKSIGFITNYDENNNEMQKISERQEYESRMNSTRLKENKNQQDRTKQIKQVKNSFKKKHENQAYTNVPYFIKSSNKTKVVQSVIDNPSSILSTSPNPLLKGLLGQYSNYQKLSKHQLIQKLISLEYLAQNIFKKNKFLQEQIEKKDIQLFQRKDKQVRKIIHKNINYQKEKISDPAVSKKQGSESRNSFVINNEDGYFNEFLQSEKGKQKQICLEFEENIQRFHENESDF